MKLIGSLVEDNIRAIMVNAHDSLFKGHEPRLLSVLYSHFPDMKTAYFLGHTPEQSEDIYWLLIDANIVFMAELDRCDLNAEPIVQKITLERYKKKLRKTDQIKLAVAMELSKKDLSSDSC